MKTFGERLKKLRGNKKQKTFAEDALDITQAYLSELETNKKNPGRELLEKLCAISGKDMNYWTGIAADEATILKTSEDRVLSDQTASKNKTPAIPINWHGTAADTAALILRDRIKEEAAEMDTQTLQRIADAARDILTIVNVANDKKTETKEAI